MLLYAVKEAHARMDPREQEALYEALAKDEALLDSLLKMQSRVETIAGGAQYMNQGGILHMQHTQYAYMPGHLLQP